MLPGNNPFAHSQVLIALRVERVTTATWPLAPNARHLYRYLLIALAFLMIFAVEIDELAARLMK
jgi:hypothetical protein